MTAYETLIADMTAPFAHITLNRPQVKNAMNAQMVADLQHVFDELHARRDIRAVTLRGAGGTFCAGGDIKELSAQSSNAAIGRGLDTMLHTINHAPQVVVAAMQGAVLGGGFGLLCVSDIALADETAVLGLPEVRIGLVPAVISPYVIARVGLTTARRLMLTGERFNAAAALQFGLIHHAVSTAALDTRLQSVLADLRQCSPNALAACKTLIHAVNGRPTADTQTMRVELLDSLRQSDDAIEGGMAFLQKRAPKWAE
jgi:isohexenylglutaconyl-CoA hydratase